MPNLRLLSLFKAEHKLSTSKPPRIARKKSSERALVRTLRKVRKGQHILRLHYDQMLS